MSNPRPDFVLFGTPGSPYVRKCMALCIEKGVEFDLIPVSPFEKNEELDEISPLKRIPVMRDRSICENGIDGTVADSSAICGMIERKHPSPALYPESAFELGRALFLEEYADNELIKGAANIFRPVFFAAVQGEEPDYNSARKCWNEEMPPIFDYLEQCLGEEEFFVGETISIADISFATSLMQVSLVANLALDNWPRLKAHLERLQKRPSIAEPFNAADGYIRNVLPERFDLT